jgi:short-subunit dehydrogenase
VDLTAMDLSGHRRRTRPEDRDEQPVPTRSRRPHRRIAIVGATGGLGSAYARRFATDGDDLLLVGRDRVALGELASSLPSTTATFVADLTQPETLRALRDTASHHEHPLDAVINATGVDVRKPLSAHTDDDITRSVAVNLTGAVRLTAAFLPVFVGQGFGTIVHTGGFVDGRLALPYHSVDAATRAGLAAFVESVNRELAPSAVRVMFFSPSAADTPAERPYHDLWRRLGVRITTPEAVARALDGALERPRTRAVMGGRLARSFAALNAIAPGLADRLALNGYHRILRAELDHAAG